MFRKPAVLLKEVTHSLRKPGFHYLADRSFSSTRRTHRERPFEVTHQNQPVQPVAVDVLKSRKICKNARGQLLDWRELRTKELEGTPLPHQ